MGDKWWDGHGERHAWSIAEVQALEDPVPAPVDKAMVGLPTPRAFAVRFARDGDARASAPSVCASVVSPALAAQQGCSGACALKAELKQLAAQPSQTAALVVETQRLQAQLEVCVCRGKTSLVLPF